MQLVRTTPSASNRYKTLYIKPLLFADGKCLIVSHDNFSTLVQEAYDDLILISKWFQVNKNSLNDKKEKKKNT